MEKTVNTAWYAKKCALGTLVCCGTELVLLMLASALMLRGAISEEMANGAVLACAAVAAFLGCMIGARKTSKRAMMTAGCAASAWVTMQVIGFFAPLIQGFGSILCLWQTACILTMYRTGIFTCRNV